MKRTDSQVISENPRIVMGMVREITQMSMMIMTAGQIPMRFD